MEKNFEYVAVDGKVADTAKERQGRALWTWIAWLGMSIGRGLL